MEDQTSILQGSLQEDSFEVVMRGYNKRQVDDYVLQCQHHIRDLAHRLALSEQETERVRDEAEMAIKKASQKPVHEEVSERLSQILRLANEEAERERTAAADEIAELRAAAAAEAQSHREQAHREVETLRRQVNEEAEALRAQVKAETEALRERVRTETDGQRERAEREAARDLERARTEADQVLSAAREASEREVTEAHARARSMEETARAESERLMTAAQERAESLVGEADRRATAINTVLGTRLELLTSTHRDVVQRLGELRSVLVNVLGKEETMGTFEVPAPVEFPSRGVAPMASVMSDPFVETAGEVAASYEAAVQVGTPTWEALEAAASGRSAASTTPATGSPAAPALGTPVTGAESTDTEGGASAETPVKPGDAGTRSLDLTSMIEKTHP